MGTGYTRNDTANNIADGNVINASDFDGEFDAIVSAFGTSGHSHDGTAAEGGAITKVGPAQQVTVSSSAIHPSTADGVALGSASNEFSDLYMADGSVIYLGADQDVSLTHVADTGVLLNSTSKIQFNDASQFIQGSSATVLSLGATDEIDLTATAIDVNGTIDISGNATFGGILSIPDGSASAPSITNTGDTNAGLYFSAADTLAFTAGGTAQFTMADGVVAPVSDNDVDLGTSSLKFKDVHVYGEVDAGSLDISGNADIDGTLEADAITVDGTALNEYIADTVGAMVGSNTETGVAVTYEDGDNTLDFILAAAQTTITSLLATDIKIGEDDQTKVDFEDANQINFYADNAKRVTIDSTGLTVNSGSIETATIDYTDGDNAMTIADGGKVTFAAGFDVGSDASGDILYHNGTSYIRLAKGTDDQVLTLASGVPSWASSAGDITGVTAGTGLSGGGTSGGVTVNVEAAQTGITSLLATDIKIGEDDQTKIDFETADEIHFYAANVEQVYLADNIFGPESDSDVDLGSTSVRWKDAYVDSITVTGEVDGASLDISGDADIDGTLEADAITVDGTALATYIRDTVGTNMLSSNTESGITVTYDTSNDNIDFAIDAAQTGITSILATDVKIGEDDQTKIDFEDADTINFYAGNEKQLILTDGALTPGTNAILDLGTDALEFKDAYFDGTVEADAITIGGTAIGSIYSAIAGSSSIVTTGALDSGSITSGFGAIDNGTSGIRTNTFTAETSILPDAVGGADLGSTSAEWGDIFIADDKAIKFGNDQDVTMEYDEDGTDTLLITGNTTLADGSYNLNIASHDGTNGLALAGTVVTATAAELNYVDGVTSSIQTQLNSAASTGKAIAMAMVFG